MPREHNWSDTYTFEGRVHRPASLDEIRRLVADSRKIRALGARHSFNALADSPGGELIDLRNIPPAYAIDRDSQTVTVGAATPYGVLAQHLQTQGWALHNLGSLPHITVAGATMTGTHGSGDRNSNLSSAVAGLELVNASGDLVTVKRGDPGFDGMVVGLGAFGIVTRMTLDIQPSFDVRQDAFVGLPWEAAMANLDLIMSAAYSVSLLTNWSGPTVQRLWLKTRMSDQAQTAFAGERLGARAAAHTALSGADDLSEALNPFGVVGPWSERLTHFRLDVEPGALEQIQSEYMVPRPHALEAVRAMHAMGARLDPHLFASEIRTMAADVLWLSPSYGHDTMALHFTWKKHMPEVLALTREIEDILLPLGGRPHWGKLMHADAARLEPLYPRMSEFRVLARAHDPEGKFCNPFLERHVFGS